MKNLLPALLSAVVLPAFGQVREPALTKLSPGLQQLAAARSRTDSIDVSVSVKKPLPSGPFRILATPSHSFLLMRLPVRSLDSLARNEQVLFINRTHPPKEEVNTGTSDPTLNQITYAQARFPIIRGDSIHVSVKERLFDTTDIDLKGRVFRTGLENANPTTHASLMATIIAGAANTSPYAIGAAPAALVTSADFANLFPDPDSLVRRYNISVQNHSYGTAVENFYGNEAVAYDKTVADNPTLLHVFSAGNSGNVTNASGPYAGIANTANLTGDFKQAKNIITVSGVDSANQLLLLSSKGPAYDGRVKPELVAYGEDGSSGAAALTSGAAVLVQDMYKRLHAGKLPAAATTKALLLNGADDVGPAGIDYASGYGSLNAFKALQDCQAGRIWEDSLAQNEIRSLTVTVPANVTRLKLTLVWTDLPAAPNASKALVNDLDLRLRSASGESWLPWVLRSVANIDSLQAPAERKVDTLNNVEQISIDHPAPGPYTIDVQGRRLQSARQAFAVAYEMDTLNTFYWTFPTATDHLMAGRTQVLRWQTNSSGSARVDFAAADGIWRLAGEVSDLSKKVLKWTVPDTVTLAQLRLTNSTGVFLSDTFTINPQPHLQTGFTCVDSFLLYWNALPVKQYRLYRLGEKYLEAVGLFPDTAAVLQKALQPSLFYSVAPLIGNREGLRSNTLNYNSQGVACYLRSFYVQTQTLSSATFTAQLGSVYKVATVLLEKWNGTAFVPLQTIDQPSLTTLSFFDGSLHAGENRYRLKIQLENGVAIYSSIETVFAVSETVPVVFYPNPVAQGSAFNVIVQEVGRYTLLFFDITGRQVYRQELTETVTNFSAVPFSKGLYLIRIIDKNGTERIHKQIIF
ncbi:S8 family peptidase [Flavisolibacter nicotianae]|uniref:S8 family peptidase n=1 Tax=Flavisolibacter nicotianae TaxID=2364882 RepID=UPI0013C53A55|nr:S8 family peptidase [Flavisolibacter nicotianae]